MPLQCGKEKAFFQNHSEKGIYDTLIKPPRGSSHAVERFSNDVKPSSSAGSS